jgi:hypothetical protein
MPGRVDRAFSFSGGAMDTGSVNLVAVRSSIMLAVVDALIELGRFYDEYEGNRRIEPELPAGKRSLPGGKC